MKLLNIFKRRKESAIQPSNIKDYRTSNLYTENEATAWSCIDRIATTFSGLSFGVYDSNTKQKINNHWLYDILKHPNFEDTHSLFFDMIIRDYYTYGNVYLYKYFNSNGELISLFRLNPSAVFVSRDKITNRKLFTVNGQTYNSDRVLQICSRWGYDGLKSKSVFDELKTSFNTALDLEQYTQNSFDNGIGKRMVIDVSKEFPDLTTEQQDKLREKYINEYSGVKNAGKPIVKTGGTELSTIDSGTQDNRSSQLTENRNYQRDLMAEIFGVPQNFLTGNVSGDLESTNILYLSFAIAPLTEQFAEAFENLLPIQERDKYFIEFNFNSTEKVSLSNRVSAYQTQLCNGILSPNEIRAKENLPPLKEAGDNFFIPSNLMPLTQENINAYMAQSKNALNQMEKSDKEKTSVGVGSDKR